MKLNEYEGKEIFRTYGIPVPKGMLIHRPDDLADCRDALGDRLVLKAQVEVAGRGKAGGIVMTDVAGSRQAAEALFAKKIKDIPVSAILAEEQLDIRKEYYLSVMIDRSAKCPIILFADAGGIDIETVARGNRGAVRTALVSPLLGTLPPFLIRDLLSGAPAEIGAIISRLFTIFREKDAILAEINPLALTPAGAVAADAKIIIDDNALGRQGIRVNRDLAPRERQAQEEGFSYVELGGYIGVIGNGAGLTMATIDLIDRYHGKAANFLDVGGGADQERVKKAVQLVASVPTVTVILVNLLGGITRCDEVARGIIEAGVHQKIMVRLAGTNEEEGRRLLARHGYTMFETMDEAVRAAVGMAT
ncbi:MAG: succinate--CoA ligase subunit beta [Methanomicrobiales archaeon]|nr:succinate--CoA ligase subunit beta [Methanomicrobiales archaeon]